MTNAELIKALRWCGGENNEWCVREEYKCPLWNEDRMVDECKADLMRSAADALEAAEAYEEAWSKKCERREKKIVELNTKCADLQSLINSMETEIEELMPKEGEWIVTTEVSDDGAVTSHINCSRCGFYWREPKHGKVFKRCPNCGAKMKGEQE